MQSTPKRQELDGPNRTWEVSEDPAGSLRMQADTADDITHVFTRDGTLLAGAPADVSASDTHAATSAGGRLGRLLRFYMGNAGRRVVLHDKNGARWPARIVGTRWHGKRAGRSWLFHSSNHSVTHQRDEKEA